MKTTKKMALNAKLEKQSMQPAAKIVQVLSLKPFLNYFQFTCSNKKQPRALVHKLSYKTKKNILAKLSMGPFLIYI
jgi:hypothetical protein